MIKTLEHNDHDLLIRVDSKVGDITATLADIKTSVKGFPAIFASREELKDVAMETEKRLCKLEDAMEGPKKYIVPIITAIGSSVVTFLIISYFEHSI